MRHDEISNPKHYDLFPGMQAIDVIEAALTPEEFAGYLKGSALKYKLRAGDKGPADKCLAKARWYQDYLRNIVAADAATLACLDGWVPEAVKASAFPSEAPTVLPDGSAFAVMSFPLPADHWLYAKRQYADEKAVEPTDLPKPILNHEEHGEAVVAAVRYAVRGATNCGAEPDFDPDALVQNAVYALCGPFSRWPEEARRQDAAEDEAFAAVASKGENSATPNYLAGRGDRRKHAVGADVAFPSERGLYFAQVKEPAE